MQKILLVVEDDQIFELKPLVDFFFLFALSFFWVTLDKDSLDVSCFVRIVVTPYFVRIFDAFKFLSLNFKAFHSFMQREEILLKVFLCASPIFELIEVEICSIPPLDPELDRSNRLVFY